MIDSHNQWSRSMNNHTPTILRVSVANIKVKGKRRPLNERKVQALAKSIRAIGLRTPISIRLRKGGEAILVAGLHRLEATKSLGEETISAIVVEPGELQRKLW